MLTICLVPVLVIAAFFYVTIGTALFLAATAGAKALTRWLRYQTALRGWRWRRASHPAHDQVPLERREVRGFVDFVREWKQDGAPEPVYDTEGERES